MAQTMHAKDTICGSLAECYITIDGKRYNFMQAIDVEAQFEKRKPKYLYWVRRGKGTKQQVGVEQVRQNFITTQVFLEKLCIDLKKQAKTFTLTCK